MVSYTLISKQIAFYLLYLLVRHFVFEKNSISTQALFIIECPLQHSRFNALCALAGVYCVALCKQT